MSNPLAATGTWSIVTFTESEADLAEVAELRPQFSGMRFVAIVPHPMAAPADLAVLVDQDSRLATQLGVRTTRSFVVDGRGTVCHHWDGVPEHEAVAVYAARPPMPSGAPVWLFPVLATIVLLAGIFAWTTTHAPAAALDLASIPPAPVVAASAEAAPVEAAEAEAPVAEPAGDVEAPEAAGADAAPAGKPGKGPRNIIGGWTVFPKAQAASIASDNAGSFTLKAVPDQMAVACRAPAPLTGKTTVSAEWNVAGVTGKAARLKYKQMDAAGKPIKDASGWTVVARGKATAGWAPATAAITPTAGAVSGVLCVEVDAGAGSVQVRNTRP
ncbi:hypothetical protein LBMAG42_41280 [Deltaproteobacteria bacterium]|nr:hypothetical protein LBMAG42_41280 [Deltaproteobacteria bacterium]